MDDGDDDLVLVGRAVAGDDRAFEVLVRRHAAGLWRLAYSLLRDDFAAEEAVQDAFANAHRSLPSFRGDASVKTWLASICHRRCLDRLRRRRLALVRLDDAPAAATATGHRDDDVRLAVEQAVERLADRERQAFTLVDVLGYTREEAAAIVDVPASTMRSRVTRARELLALSLADVR